MTTQSQLLLTGILILAGAPLPAADAGSPDLFQKRRAELITRYDRNGNGRLEAEERDTMRLARQAQPGQKSSGSNKIPADVLADYDENKDGDMDEMEWVKARHAETRILTQKFDANGDGSLDEMERFTMMSEVRTVPMRYARDYFAYLMNYDKNRNGEFDGDEYALAMEGEAMVLTRTYDANGDGVIDNGERGTIEADLRKNVIKGFAQRFAREFIKGEKRGKSDNPQTTTNLLEFDTDGDGIASREELRRIRESRGH